MYKIEISAEKTKLLTNNANGNQREIKVKKDRSWVPKQVWRNQWTITICMTVVYYEVKHPVTLSHYSKQSCSYIKKSSKYKINHCAMKYRSLGLETTLGHTESLSQESYSYINSLQDIGQNNWTLKYRSLWPNTYIV